jgi:hypothetical protein
VGGAMTTEERVELSFLKDCHKVKSLNFDNSEEVPKDIKDKYRNQIEDKMEDLWQRYVHWKFCRLYELEQDSQISIAEFKSELAKRGTPDIYLKEFVEVWDEKRRDEELAYLYRYTQLPLEIVHKCWYPPNHCYDWCRLQQEKIKHLDSCEPNKSWGTKFLETCGKISQEPSMDFYRDWALALTCRKGLTKKIEDLHEDLMRKPATLEEFYQYQDIFNEIKNNFKSILSEYGVLPLKHQSGGFLAELSISLVESIYREGFNEDALIRSFLFELKDIFKCEVCDFVEVEEEGDLIVWRVATVSNNELSDEYKKIPIEKVRLNVRRRESYKKGEGISGTILLLEDDMKTNLWHHIGSNDVLLDPRASTHIRHAYEEDIYPYVLQDGKIHNFWMFPIFHDRKLIGAFRVVNKLDSEAKLQVGGWPYIARVELSLIANWFSKFLEASQPLLLKPEESLAFISWGREVDKLMEKAQLAWIDRKFFSAILHHFSRIIFKKEEKRIMGSSVLIMEETNATLPIAFPFDNYPGIDVGPSEIVYPYHNLDSLLDIIDPLRGTFVFNGKGDFKRVVTLECENKRGNGFSGYDAICTITKKPPRSLFILLPRDTRNIFFYKDGEKIAELYMAERLGEWKFRSIEYIRDILFNHSEIDDTNVLEMVLDASLELSSRRLGGLIVLGKLSKDTFTFQQGLTYIRGLTPLENIGSSRLVDFIKLDGATIIDSSGRLIRTNSIIRPLRDPGNLEIFRDRGGRHKIGEEICRLAPHALVIIISENGGISILKNKKDLIKNC